MRVSELPITIGTLHRVETTTDAIQLISNFDQLDRYVAKYGDVEIVQDGRTYRVPEFAARIKRYTELKAYDCARNGCE